MYNFTYVFVFMYVEYHTIANICCMHVCVYVCIMVRSAISSFDIYQLHFLTGRYINDCISPHGWNVEFLKLPQDWMALVVATRDICPGEELFVSYGLYYTYPVHVYIHTYFIIQPDMGLLMQASGTGCPVRGRCVCLPNRLPYPRAAGRTADDYRSGFTRSPVQ